MYSSLQSFCILFQLHAVQNPVDYKCNIERMFKKNTVWIQVVHCRGRLQLQYSVKNRRWYTSDKVLLPIVQTRDALKMFICSKRVPYRQKTISTTKPSPWKLWLTIDFYKQTIVARGTSKVVCIYSLWGWSYLRNLPMPVHHKDWISFCEACNDVELVSPFIDVTSNMGSWLCLTKNFPPVSLPPWSIY